MTDLSNAAQMDLSICTVEEFYARLKMCGLSYLKRATDYYALYQDRNGEQITVRIPESLSGSERASVIEHFELMYPLAGHC